MGKKAWLEDFYAYVMSLGGTTAEVLGDILRKEADFRVLLVALNSMNTPMVGSDAQRNDRNVLYPNFGYLYPEGTRKLREAWNDQTIQAALEPYPRHAKLYNEVKGFYDRQASTAMDPQQILEEMKSNLEAGKGGLQGSSIEDLIYKEMVHIYEMSFEQQYHFGVFYSWVKLREQEIRNIRWISNMIVLKAKDHIDDTIVPIFQPRM